MKYISNIATFIVLYIIFMIPTYVLPYIGSNSTLINSAGVAANAGLNPALYLHIASLIGLIAFAWLRGKCINKNWLVALAIIAAVFDITPILSSIPLIPSIFHILTLALGVIGSTNTQPSASTA